MKSGRIGLAGCALAIGGLLGALLAACGGRNGTDPEVGASLTTAAPTTSVPTTTTTVLVTTTTTQPPTTTTTTTAPGQLTDELRAEIIAGYDAADAAFLEAIYHPVDPELPAIRETRTAGTAATTSAYLNDLVARGWAARPTHENQETHEVLSVRLLGPAQAALEVCGVSDAVFYEVTTGEIVNDVVGTALYNVIMQLEDSTWKLASSEQAVLWEGVASCDVPRS